MEKRIDLLKEGFHFLSKEGLANPRAEAEIFLSHIINCPRLGLYLDERPVAQKESQDYWHLLRQRAKGRPLQYLIGYVEFMGLKFRTVPEVFIPRPETEILVEKALELLTLKSYLSSAILDIGTGCGNIAISIAKEIKKTDIFACDISDSALQLAEENAHLNKVEINLIKSNLFSAFKKKNYFSLILSNPPYIRSDAIPGLSRELHYEPRGAIDAGNDGLLYYRAILSEAAGYLSDKGMLILEIGDNQGALIKEIAAKTKRLSVIEVIRDYNDIERIIVAEKQR